MIDGWEKLKGISLNGLQCTDAYSMPCHERIDSLGLNLNPKHNKCVTIYKAHVSTEYAGFIIMAFPIKHSLQIAISWALEDEAQIVFPITDSMKESPNQFMSEILRMVVRPPFGNTKI